MEESDPTNQPVILRRQLPITEDHRLWCRQKIKRKTFLFDEPSPEGEQNNKLLTIDKVYDGITDTTIISISIVF